MKSIKDLTEEEREKIRKGECPCGGKLGRIFFDGGFGPNGKRGGFGSLMCEKCDEIYTV